MLINFTHLNVMLSLVGVRQRVSQLTHSYGRFTHTHTLYTHLLVMTTYTQCVWEREMADLAGSALETESRKTVRTPAKRQQQRPQQHPVVATAAAVHTGARHQCIPVNMQQQCVASIHTHMHIHTCTCTCTYQKEKVAGSCCCTTKKQTVGRRWLRRQRRVLP